jgi:hypothetical protein
MGYIISRDQVAVIANQQAEDIEGLGRQAHTGCAIVEPPLAGRDNKVTEAVGAAFHRLILLSFFVHYSCLQVSRRAVGCAQQ